eukprot:scaffold6323_cov121-Isochrysis_galbana.AAC.11
MHTHTPTPTGTPAIPARSARLDTPAAPTPLFDTSFLRRWSRLPSTSSCCPSRHAGATFKRDALHPPPPPLHPPPSTIPLYPPHFSAATPPPSFPSTPCLTLHPLPHPPPSSSTPNPLPHPPVSTGARPH